MRGRAGVLICLGVVALASLWTYEPRLHHEFPSLVDDWSAIQNAPEQLHSALRLGYPEDGRYRPGFVMWNALQWHTLGAPTEFLGPQLWGAARWAVLVIGVTLLALLLVGRPTRLRDGRWLLTIGVPLVAVTAPSIAIDIARYGPQEPLLVGCMSLGAVLLVRAIDRLLDGEQSGPAVLSAVGGGLILWAFGVLQKEPSICVLLLAPFLWPTIRDQQGRWELLDARRRRGLEAVRSGHSPSVRADGRQDDATRAHRRPDLRRRLCRQEPAYPAFGSAFSGGRRAPHRAADDRRRVRNPAPRRRGAPRRGGLALGRSARRRSRLHRVRGAHGNRRQPLLHPGDHARRSRPGTERRPARVGRRGRRRGAADRRRALHRTERPRLGVGVGGQRAGAGGARPGGRGACRGGVSRCRRRPERRVCRRIAGANAPRRREAAGLLAGRALRGPAGRGRSRRCHPPDNPVLAACRPDPEPFWLSSVGRILRCTA